MLSFLLIGRREGNRACEQIRCQKMDSNSPSPKRQDRKTMSGEVAQSPQSKDQKERLDRARRSNNLQSASGAWQSMGQDCKAAPWKVSFSLKKAVLRKLTCNVNFKD